jgi:3-oxoacyl-[acyl-carrier-protein] synthase II
MTIPNSASAWVSILFSIGGDAATINAACASGTIAISEAYRKIRDGYHDVMVTGGVESLRDPSGSVMRGFDSLGALVTAPEGIPLPFSKKRSGFLFSEGGGCVLILEELAHALDRGAGIYAEVAGYEANSDCHHVVQMNPDTANVDSLLRILKGDSRIDYINAHGTGTVQNDETEARAIRAVFGTKSNQPYINSTKGLIGHTLGASGAIEAAVVAYAIKRSRLHANRATDIMDQVNLVTETREADIESAISASYGFGGHNAAIFFRRFHGA